MIKQTFYGKAEDGEFVHEQPGYFRKFMRDVEDERSNKKSQRLEMTVKVYRKPRSTGLDGRGNQNGYYWAVIVRMIADEIGELDQDVVNDWIQVAVGHVRVMPDGTKVPLGTKELDTVEFEEYCSRARMWAATPGAMCEAGMYIPLPNETEYA